MLTSKEFEILDTLSRSGDWIEFPGYDPERDALISRLKARGLVSDNILGEYKITGAGLNCLASLSSRQQPVNDDRQQRDDKIPRHQPSRGKLIAGFKWFLGILGAIIATVVAAYIVSRLGW